MPNFSGFWTSRQQMQAIGPAGAWPTAPGAPTIGIATGGDASASVTFTAPANIGYPAGITGYTVTSNPSGIVATGASSPITVSGLTNGTAYTFTVTATNASGAGPASAASNSTTPQAPQQVAYTDGGTYSFIVPAGLSPSSVSVVCVGGGAGSSYASGTYYGGGGGGLRYQNNITGLTAGQSITVTVAGTVYWTSNTLSSFGTSGVDSFYFFAGGGQNSSGGNSSGGTGTTIGGNIGGGNGGSANGAYAGGGGAGGYSGNGGNGNNGTSGSGGGGGGGGSGSPAVGGGGGVGLLGQGANGAGGGAGNTGGGGGSGGANGSGGTTGYSANGGLYGGGAGGDYAYTNNYGAGAGGAVRIIYSTSGVTRSFPSTNTGNL